MLQQRRVGRRPSSGTRRTSKIASVVIFASIYIQPAISFVSSTLARHRYTALSVKESADGHDVRLLQKKTVVELKQDLKSKKLTVSGTKAKLIQRLLDYDASTRDVLSDAGEGWLVDDASDQSGKSSAKILVDASFPLASGSKSIVSMIPSPLLESLAKKLGDVDGPILLPVQEGAYKPIASGSDAVLFAPTGSGKTLAYAIPILSRLIVWKRTGILKKRKRLSQIKYNSKREPACPPILVMAPSRELSKQIGKVFSQYHPTSSGRVAAVFGGVPLERHASLLRRDLDVIVGTPGRIRELIREGHFSTSHVKTIVLDEADILLNFDDQPEIEMLLEGLEGEFQLVLASATVDDRVREFMKDVTDIDEDSEGFVFIKGDSSNAAKSALTKGARGAPKVNHWCTAARSSARPGLAADFVATLSPRLGIIFVASKVEADAVAEEMSDRLADVKVCVLHGDMSQSARSRTVASLRQAGGRRKILVATDVASRGLDLPGVDLVVQFGIPRQSGKEGTFDRQLYMHRSGRAGRVGGGSRPADAILMYDPSEGEGRTLQGLETELETLGVHLEPRPLPSPTDVLHASYERAKGLCSDVGEDVDFVSFFRDNVESEMEQVPADEREDVLLDRLAAAMAALSGLSCAVPERSLLTADPRDRTVRVWSDDGEALSPSEVTRFAKALGSGKLGRVTVCGDGSAVFDLVEKRAMRLVQAAEEVEMDGEARKIYAELPSELSETLF